MNHEHGVSVLIQILFIAGLAIGSNGILNEKYKWLNIPRYIIYVLSIKSIPTICTLAHKHYTGTRTGSRLNWPKLLDSVRPYAVTYAASVALLLYFDEKLFKGDFIYVFVAFLILQYSDMSAKAPITYGVGMACSFFEGYLVHVIPSDGAKFVGFEENIRMLEAREGILFPVKKLFIIVTKSLYCPPDLKDFNKSSDELPYLESMGSLEDVIKNVAGVKNRQYRNTAYKIYRPGPGADAGSEPDSPRAAPVCLAAECATPLHTLYRVVNNRTLYDELTDIDVPSVVEDFTTTLKKIIEKSPQCRGKCELVIFDNEDPSQNLADILLERIRHFEPKFEEKIEARRRENIIED